MKTLLKIWLGVLMFSSISYSQPVTWQKYFDNNNRNDVGYGTQQTFDGGYIFACTTIRGGSYQDILLIKVNYLGNLEWKKIIGDSSKFAFEMAHAIKQTPDSGFVIAGNGNNTILLLKTDKVGNVQWRRDFTMQNGEARGMSLKLTNDGGIVICGDIFFLSLSAIYPYVVKTDGNGNLQWQKYYPDLFNYSAQDIVESKDSNYFLCSDDIVRKINNEGKIIWTKYLIGSLGYLTFQSIIFESPDIIYAGGGSDSSGTKAMHLFKIDSAGNVLWQKRFLPSQVGSHAYSICMSGSGDIVMTGNVWGEDLDVGFVRVSSQGELLIYSILTSPGLNEDAAYSIDTTRDNGFIIAGSTEFGGTEVYPNVYAIKTDSNGYAHDIVNINNNLTIIKDFELYQNYPNPFNISTTIKYELKSTSFVNLKIYDVTGKEISNVVAENQSPGIHSIIFEADNFSSGIYFYKLEIINGFNKDTKKKFSEIKKMIFLK